MTQLSERQTAALVQLGLPSHVHPYPVLKNVLQKVSKIAGTTVESIESRIDAALASEPDLTDFLELLQERRSHRRQQSLAGWDDITFYGSVIDEVLRTERNKLRLSLLSSVVHQNHLVHATVVGPWIPASVLESANPPVHTLKKLSDEFFHNLQRALPSIGFEHVFFVGFTELSKQFGSDPDHHDVAMAADWYLRRGEIYWKTATPSWPQYSWHAHLIGGAVQFQNYADADEIDEAFDRLFPERWAVRVDPWIQKRDAVENVAGLSNYLWKIGPHRQCNPHRPMPPPEEIRANARLWNVVGHHRRNFDLNGYWPEIGSRRLPLMSGGSLKRLDAMRRQMAWDAGLKIWTSDDFEPRLGDAGIHLLGVDE